MSPREYGSPFFLPNDIFVGRLMEYGEQFYAEVPALNSTKSTSPEHWLEFRVLTLPSDTTISIRFWIDGTSYWMIAIAHTTGNWTVTKVVDGGGATDVIASQSGAKAIAAGDFIQLKCASGDFRVYRNGELIVAPVTTAPAVLGESVKLTVLGTAGVVAYWKSDPIDSLKQIYSIADIVVSGDLDVTGDFTIGGIAYTADDGAIGIPATGSAELLGHIALDDLGVESGGDITVGSGAVVYVNGTIQVDGDMNIEGATGETDVVMLGSGEVEGDMEFKSGSTLTVDGAQLIAGALTIPTGETLDVDEDSTVSVAGAVNLAGALDFEDDGAFTVLGFDYKKVQNVYASVTTAEVNSGETVVAPPGLGFALRLLDFKVTARGGAVVDATSVDLKDEDGVAIAAIAVAALTENRPVGTDTAGVTHGAGSCGALLTENMGIEIVKNGSDVDGATSFDVFLKYMIDDAPEGE